MGWRKRIPSGCHAAARISHDSDAFALALPPLRRAARFFQTEFLALLGARGAREKPGAVQALPEFAVEEEEGAGGRMAHRFGLRARPAAPDMDDRPEAILGIHRINCLACNLLVFRIGKIISQSSLVHPHTLVAAGKQARPCDCGLPA